MFVRNRGLVAKRARAEFLGRALLAAALLEGLLRLRLLLLLRFVGALSHDYGPTLGAGCPVSKREDLMAYGLIVGLVPRVSERSGRVTTMTGLFLVFAGLEPRLHDRAVNDGEAEHKDRQYRNWPKHDACIDLKAARTRSLQRGGPAYDRSMEELRASPYARIALECT